MIIPMENEICNVGQISDTFRNFFEKFVEKGFSEKSKSIISNNENGKIQKQIFNSNTTKDRGMSLGNQYVGQKNNETHTDYNYINDQLRHLHSYNSFSSSAPLGKRQNQNNYDEIDDPFDNADGIMSIDNSIPVRILKGGRLQKKNMERMSMLNSEKASDRQNRKTITVYKSLINDELKNGNYTGIKHSKTLKNDEEISALLKGKNNKNDSFNETNKDLMKESTYDERSLSTVKHSIEHPDLKINKNGGFKTCTEIIEEDNDKLTRLKRYRFLIIFSLPVNNGFYQPTTKTLHSKTISNSTKYNKLKEDLENLKSNKKISEKTDKGENAIFSSEDAPITEARTDNPPGLRSSKSENSYLHPGEKYLVEEEKVADHHNESKEIEENTALN